MDQPIKLPNKSSQIHSATYDPQTERLTLVLNGGTYAYHGVPQDVVTGLQQAQSHGDFFHQNIKSGKKFQFNRIR